MPARQTQTALGSLKRTVKGVLYGTGLLRAWHRRRNADCLTVVGFHRVIAKSDPRYPGSNPAYTVTPEELDRCLVLLRANYEIVSIDDVVAARAGRRSLPPCALLVTFDDGWRDNMEYALPVLRRHLVRAVLFVATGHIGSVEGFWQEELLDGVRRGRFAAPDGVDRLLATLSAMPPAERERALERYPAAQDLPPRMAAAEDLKALATGGVVLGGHGHSHEPLTAVPDAPRELAECRSALAGIEATQGPLPFSFPHGRYDAALVESARENGFDPLFTSTHELVPYAALGGRRVIGRIEMDLRSVRRFRSPFDAAGFLHFVMSQPKGGAA